jgi:hypothetical protein
MKILSLVGHLKQNMYIQLFTIYTRYLIGSAFVIAAFGMGKIINSFPIMTENNAPVHSIGRLFETFTHSGLYWQFIGWSQVMAGLLLMTQKFARLGAVIFLPIIINIFVITVSYDFQGTPIVTGLMLLANLYLILWDTSALQYILINPSRSKFIDEVDMKVMNKNLWAMTGLILFVTIVILSLLKINLALLMLTCLAEGLIILIYYLLKISNTK